MLSQLGAQEMVVPLTMNPKLSKPLGEVQKKKTRAAALPFIDDFSYEGPYPNPSLWEDQHVFINNTMAVLPINRGVATFDGLDRYGRPYVSTQSAISTADSLTSVPIDLSAYSSTNNIFLSFFVQPEGLGFAPETKDSLFLYFKNNNNQWQRVWQLRGTTFQPFKIYFVPVADQQFMHAGFQFRFVNLASPNINDDDWHLDYVKMDVNRSFVDSIQNEIGFSIEPTSILKPYTEMPYSHFQVNQSNWLQNKQFTSIVNTYPVSQPINLKHEAWEKVSSSLLHTESKTGSIVPAKSSITDSFLSYTITHTPPPDNKVIVEDRYYFNPVSGVDRRINDTISRITTFDNYFAYDDGSAEKSYFLLSAFNYPAKTALEFHLNHADTIRGLAVHFGAQVPSGSGKYFTITLYKQLAGSGLNDSIIHSEDLFQVMYDTSYNAFSYYAFQQPVVADSGKYYIGITQPANFGSDSVYYGLDVNTSANKDYLYYNVSGIWESSSITNASIMMRPMVGRRYTPTAIPSVSDGTADITIYPNPCSSTFRVKGDYQTLALYDLNGRKIKSFRSNEELLDISSLPDQLYILVITDKNKQQRFFKLYKN